MVGLGIPCAFGGEECYFGQRHTTRSRKANNEAIAIVVSIALFGHRQWESASAGELAQLLVAPAAARRAPTRSQFTFWKNASMYFAAAAP